MSFSEDLLWVIIISGGLVIVVSALVRVLMRYIMTEAGRPFIVW